MAHSVPELFLQVQNWLEEKMLLSNELPRAWRVITLMQSPGEQAGAQLCPQQRSVPGLQQANCEAAYHCLCIPACHSPLKGAAGFKPFQSGRSG